MMAGRGESERREEEPAEVERVTAGVMLRSGMELSTVLATDVAMGSARGRLEAEGPADAERVIAGVIAMAGLMSSGAGGGEAGGGGEGGGLGGGD